MMISLVSRSKRGAHTARARYDFPILGKPLLERSSLSRFRRSAPRRTSRSARAPHLELTAASPSTRGFARFAFAAEPRVFDVAQNDGGDDQRDRAEDDGDDDADAGGNPREI
jgi:hypothetical protein